MVQTEEQKRAKNTEYHKRWKTNNPEKAKALSKQYYEKNKDKIRKYHREYRTKNRERVLELQRKYAKEHPDKKHLSDLQYRLRNPELKRNYYQRNKDKIQKVQNKWQMKQYYENPEWKRKLRVRQATQRLAQPLKGLSCIICNTKKELQRHHPSYDSLDFVVVCRRCHQDIHNFVDKRWEYKHLTFSEKKDKEVKL